MKALILVTGSDGHHLEYVEHLLQMTYQSEDTFVFCLHPRFRNFDSISKFKSDNVIIEYMSDSEVQFPINRLLYSYKVCRLLKNKINKHEANKVFLIMLMPFGPFVFLPIWGNVKISGIIYNIYLYKWKTEGWVAKCYDVMRFWLMARNKNIKSVFILNDQTSSQQLNDIYKSEKFIYLVDPFRPIENLSDKYNLRKKYKDKTIVSHIGHLKERKGSYDILRAIDKMDKDLLSKFVFVFAGKAEDEPLFANLINNAKTKCPVEWYNGFLRFEEMGEIVNSSDLLLLPYHNTNQSSGIISYGAQFSVPVAVPNADLLAALVKTYKLGYLMNGYSIDDIISFLQGVTPQKNSGADYLKVNNVNSFISIINNNF